MTAWFPTRAGWSTVAAPRSSDDAPIWPADALLAFCAHADADVRRWAVERLADERAPAALPALVARLEDADASVILRAVEALEALGGAAPPDAVRAPRRRVIAREDLPPGTCGQGRDRDRAQDPETDVDATEA